MGFAKMLMKTKVVSLNFEALRTPKSDPNFD